MKKFILTIFVGLLIFGFTFAQTTQVDVNVLNRVIDLLQNLIKSPTPSVATSTLPSPISSTPSPAEIKVTPLPRGVSPAVPLEKPITPEVIRPILPDENREDDIIVQLNNLRITRIVTSTPFLTSDTRAIFFTVRDVGWRCLMFESEEASTGTPCLMNLRKSIDLKELAIKVTNDTILLQRNRQRSKLEDFQVNDKINVYGFMDKDNYGIEALIVRKIGTQVSKPTKFDLLPSQQPLPQKLKQLPQIRMQQLQQMIHLRDELRSQQDQLPTTTSLPERPICIQVITPAYNPQNPSECKEFPTPCDIPSGWVKTKKCPVKSEEGAKTTLLPNIAHKEVIIEADDYGFYPASLEVPKGATVSLIFKVRETGVYYGGLDFRSEKFKTEVLKPGNSTKVIFVADKDFTISSYWPMTNVKKAEMKVLVK